MKTTSIALGLIAAFTVSGCAQSPLQPSDFENLAKIPAPKTQEEHDKTCATLRTEIAQLWNIANSATSPAMYPFKTRVKARTAVSDVEAKAAAFECGFVKDRNRFDI